MTIIMKIHRLTDMVPRYIELYGSQKVVTAAKKRVRNPFPLNKYTSATPVDQLEYARC